jgi:hypothetical protein
MVLAFVMMGSWEDFSIPPFSNALYTFEGVKSNIHKSWE